MEKKHRIIKGAIFLFLGKISTALIESLHIFLIPRLLGPTNMGFYSYWVSVYFIIARILGLGGQHIIIKYVPEMRIKNEFMIPSLVKKVVSMKIPLFLLIVGSGFLLFPDEIFYFLIIAFASLLFSLNLAGESVIFSYNWMGPYASIPLIRIASRTILVLSLFYFFQSTGIVVGIFGAPLIAFSLCLFLSLRVLPKKQIPLDPPFKTHFAFGFWIYISEAIQGMIVWIITVLSKIYIKDMAVVGYFGVGVQICFSMIILIYFINESILPSLVEFRVIDDQKLRDSLKLAWKYTNILLFPLIFGGFVLAEPIIGFFIGKDYLAGTQIIKLFFPTIIFFSWVRFHNQILFVYGKKIKIFLTQIINLSVFLGAWFVLIRMEKIQIAPLSLCLGVLTAYVFILYHSIKITKVENYIPNLFKPLAASALMAFILILFKTQTIFQLLGLVFLGFLFYVLFLFVLKGFGREDFKILKEFLKSAKILPKKGSDLNVR